MNDRAYIIAEAGNNHNGNLETAIKLVDVAKSAGADSVKFQIIYPEGLYVRELVKDKTREPNPILAIREKSMLTDDHYRELKKYSDSVGIEFSASVFDERGIKLLCELNVPYIKIASTDLNNTRLLRQAAETKKRLIISTGMSELSEIEKSVNLISKYGSSVVLLHCVSVYPCPTAIMNLGFIDILKSAFGLPVGLSDHSESSLAVAVSIGKGISCVEKHYTLNRSQEGFDHAYAMEPDQFTRYVNDIRNVESACARPKEKLTEQERGVMARARRGIYFSRDIAAGETISPSDVIVVRPPSAFRADQIDKVIGKQLKTGVESYSAVAPENLS